MNEKLVFTKKVKVLNNVYIIRIPSDLNECFSKDDLIEVSIRFINVDEKNKPKGGK